LACSEEVEVRRIRGSGSRATGAVAAGLSGSNSPTMTFLPTFIYLVEHGCSRPSPRVLELIARRTGKRMRYVPGPAEHVLPVKPGFDIRSHKLHNTILR